MNTATAFNNKYAPEDVLVFPDGFWRFREQQKEDDSDDYYVIKWGTPEYDNFLADQ